MRDSKCLLNNVYVTFPCFLQDYKFLFNHRLEHYKGLGSDQIAFIHPVVHLHHVYGILFNSATPCELKERLRCSLYY